MTATPPSATADAAEDAASRLYEAATRDALTGLPNRHFFREAAERALLLASRQQSPVTVLAVDVDGFDRLLDRHGAAAGDAVLQRLGVLLEDLFRRSDLIARLAGPTFAVLLPGAGHRNALVLAEKLRATVEADTGGAPAITVSVGIAVAAPDNQASLDPLLDLADAAMRAARATGPNRVVEA
jgi:diguanylate cyclase (GGDEF)-like protein